MARNESNIDVNVNVNGADSINEATSSLNELRETADNATESFNELGGDSSVFDDIKGKISGAVGAVRGFAKSFGTVKGAIAATGIGALLIAVTSLVSYFKNTEKGAKTLRIATEALGIIMGKITDIFTSLGTKMFDTFTNPQEAIESFKESVKNNITNRIEGLIELFPKLGEAISLAFRGKFSEAAKVATDATAKASLGVENITDKAVALGEKAKDAYGTIVAETTKAVVQATAYINAQDNLRNSINALTVANAELNRESELQKQIGEDTTLTYERRKEALDAAGVAQLQLAENVAKQAALEENLIRLQISNTRNVEERKELENQLSEQIATRIEAEAAISLERADIAKVDRELYQEEIDRVESLNALIRESNVDNTQSKYEALQAQLQLDEDAALLEADRLKATEEEKLAIINGFKQQRLDLKAEEDEELTNIEQEKLDKLAAELEAEQRLIEQANATKLALNRELTAATLNEYELSLFNAENAYADDLENYKKLLEDKIITQAEYAAISSEREQIYADEIVRINKDAAEQEKADQQRLNQQKLQGVSNILSATASLVELFAGKGKEQAKKAFKLQKGLQIAQAGNQTIQGAIQAFTSLSAIPVVGVGLGIAAAAAAATSGIANIAKIKATTFDAEGGSGTTPSPTLPSLSSGASSSLSNTSTATPTPTPPSINLYGEELDGVNNGSSQNVGERQQVLKAYVVESDITDAQNTIQSYKERSQIG